MTTLDILRLARERLSDARRWRQGGGVGEDGSLCAGLTISLCAMENARPFYEAKSLSFETHMALANAIGSGRNVPHNAVYAWNDDPQTTHADVLTGLDRAIAIEVAKEQEFSPAMAARQTVAAAVVASALAVPA